MLNRGLFILLSFLLLTSCGDSRRNDNEPFFESRGIILAWNDVSNPDVIDWIAKMNEVGLNTVSVFGYDYQSDEYSEMKQKFIDNGIDFVYEEHAMSWLLPRELFKTHPEYFRMDSNGVRQPDFNGCPSNKKTLDIVFENAKKLGKANAPTNHKYYFWLYDGGEKCYCHECVNYNDADQGLLFENTIIKALKEIDSSAQLAHLAYDKTTPAPSCVKPEDGIFLEFAPFYRRWDKPLSDREARREGQEWSHGDYLDMLEDNLKVFSNKNAQVLEYWLDVSLVSGWQKPQKKLLFSKEVFKDDLNTYAGYGIQNITSYGAWIDDYYVKTYEDISFINEFGEGLYNFKVKN
jgi:hypothetical protein